MALIDKTYTVDYMTGKELLDFLGERQKEGVDMFDLSVQVYYDDTVMTFEWVHKETPEEEAARLKVEKHADGVYYAQCVELAKKRLAEAEQAYTDYKAGKPRKMPF